MAFISVDLNDLFGSNDSEGALTEENSQNESLSSKSSSKRKRIYKLVTSFTTLEEAEEYIKNEFPTNKNKRRKESESSYRTYYDCQVDDCGHKCVLEVPSYNRNFNILESENVKHSHSHVVQLGINNQAKESIKDSLRMGKFFYSIFNFKLLRSFQE